MLHDFMYALWFFLPAGVANLAPVLAAKMPLLKDFNMPVDGNAHYRGKRLLGSSKTWRGFISGVLAAILLFWLQKALSGHMGSFTTYLDATGYRDFTYWLAILLGAGALIGDSVKSFFKRQLTVPPGHSWFPFDQIDYIVGGSLFSLLVTTLPLKMYAWILLVWFLMHLAFSYIGYLSGFKKTPI